MEHLRPGAGFFGADGPDGEDDFFGLDFGGGDQHELQQQQQQQQQQVGARGTGIKQEWEQGMCGQQQQQLHEVAAHGAREQRHDFDFFVNGASAAPASLQQQQRPPPRQQQQQQQQQQQREYKEEKSTTPTLDATELKLEFEDVLDLIEGAMAKPDQSLIPCRPQASPISTECKLFLVNSALKHLLTDKEREHLLGSPSSLLPVKYQGFSNGEVWWSAKHNNVRGLVARNMTRKSHKSAPSATECGFSGRWFALIQRDSPSTRVPKTDVRSFVVAGAPSLVQFWSPEDAERFRINKESGQVCLQSRLGLSLPLSRKARQSIGREDGSNARREMPFVKAHKKRKMLCEIESKHQDVTKGTPDAFGSPSSSGSESLDSGNTDVHNSDSENSVAAGERRQAASMSNYGTEAATVLGGHDQGDTIVVRKNLHIMGNCTIDGDLVANNLRLRGQLVTPPKSADYAEWFPRLDPSEKIESGDCVQLRSPAQKITLDTSGRGPIMVVSTTPSVAAGVPDDADEKNGSLCGFLGQLPAKVHGPIKCGEHLFPSGNNDGVCVPGDIRHVGREPVATAMESCGTGIHTINTFVRWSQDRRWSRRRKRTEEIHDVSVNVWKLAMVCVLYLLIRGSYLVEDRLEDYGMAHVLVFCELVHLGICFANYPVYPEFARRDCWVGVVLFTLDVLHTAHLAWLEITMQNSPRGMPSPEDNQSVSVAQMRSILLHVFQAQVHIILLLVVLRVYSRARQLILGLERADEQVQNLWRERLHKSLSLR